MSQRKKKAPKSVLFDGFSGIDTRFSHWGKTSSADVKNFRITDSGALQKRCGFARYAGFNSSIRDVWTGIINGNERCVLLCGNEIFISDLGANTFSSLGKVGTTEGKARFFYYRDRLYLMDGQKLYELLPSSLAVSETLGYVPLIGKDWQTGERGEIHEPRNLLCDKGRISYKIEAYPTVYLHTGWLAKSVDAVYLNGVLADPSAYTYNTIFNTVDMRGLNEGDEVLIYVTYATPEDTELANGLLTCSAALNFGAIGGDRIFTWGGTKKNMLYCSEFVSHEALEASLAAYPKSSPLYFPMGYEFAAGDGRHAVRAAIRHYDRLLVFTEADAWNASVETSGAKDIPLSSINSGAGCLSECAVGMAKNSPVSVGKRTIFAWNADTDEFNECNAKSISEAIDPLLSKSFFENAAVFNAHKYNELWFHSKGDESTWIYNVNTGAWYRFTGFDADGFFELFDDVFFYDGSAVYRFDDTLKTDRIPDENGEEAEVNIHASFKSAVLEFETSEKKRFESFTLHANTDGEAIKVRIDTDSLAPIEFTLQEKNDPHSILFKRLHAGRFCYAALTFSSSGATLPKIFSAELRVRE